MTQDEIIEMARFAGIRIDSFGFQGGFIEEFEAFAKLVAAKAIAELESQEPVAWVAEDVCEGQYINGRPRKIWWECKEGVGTAFYTNPPQRTWVDLTDEEVFEICNSNYNRDSELVQMIEAKLKERNT